MNMVLGKDEADEITFKYSLYAMIGNMNFVYNQTGRVY